MDKTTIACAPTNFMSGRPSGLRVEAIVLHRTGGTSDEIRVRFQDASTATSAHYLVGKDGSVIQYVDEPDTAFHAGLVVNPTWALLKPKVNPNFYTIGIELEGSPGDAVPDAQSDGCAALVAEIAARCSIPIDENHIVLHSEIRASRDCPGASFERADLIQRALLSATSQDLISDASEVGILKDSNLREGLPSSSARIVSVLSAGGKARVSGFTLVGEALQGNSAWYRNEDGNFFWAGNSSVPQPAAPENKEQAEMSEATPVAPSGPVPAGPIGITEIDTLFTAAACPPLDLTKAGRDATGAIQDLLTGHGFAKLPSILTPGYGTLNTATSQALLAFQNNCGLPSDPALSAAVIKQLVALPAKDPRATRAHLSLVLGIPFTGMNRVLALTAQMEGVGKFAAMNLNTDSAGLSFGLIQWAQKPGRLSEIVSAFRVADEEAFVRIFGQGDTALCDRLIGHLKKPNGGVSATGATTDPAFDLIASPWAGRFGEAALFAKFQQVQVNTALKAFGNSLTALRKCDTAGIVKSERAVAFMLDVANQFGDGGLASQYRKVFRPAISERDLLQGVADSTVAAMAPRFQPGVSARRSLFLTTPLLSDSSEFQAT